MKKCKVLGCNRVHKGHGFCDRHYQQYKKYGSVKDNPLYNKFAPNEFVFKNKICKVILRDQQGYFKAESIIDIEDYEKIRGCKWFFNAVGYCYCEKLRTPIAHVILNHEPNNKILIDHKNRNKLDNRKSNLRLCNKSQNAINSKIRVDNTSGVRGVYWNNQKNKWQAQIGINGKVINLGRFKNKKDAAKARKNAETKYHER